MPLTPDDEIAINEQFGDMGGFPAKGHNPFDFDLPDNFEEMVIGINETQVPGADGGVKKISDVPKSAPIKRNWDDSTRENIYKFKDFYEIIFNGRGGLISRYGDLGNVFISENPIATFIELINNPKLRLEIKENLFDYGSFLAGDLGVSLEKFLRDFMDEMRTLPKITTPIYPGSKIKINTRFPGFFEPLMKTFNDWFIKVADAAQLDEASRKKINNELIKLIEKMSREQRKIINEIIAEIVKDYKGTKELIDAEKRKRRYKFYKKYAPRPVSQPIVGQFPPPTDFAPEVDTNLPESSCIVDSADELPVVDPNKRRRRRKKTKRPGKKGIGKWFLPAILVYEFWDVESFADAGEVLGGIAYDEITDPLGVGDSLFGELDPGSEISWDDYEIKYDDLLDSYIKGEISYEEFYEQAKEEYITDNVFKAVFELGIFDGLLDPGIPEFRTKAGEIFDDAFSNLENEGQNFPTDDQIKFQKSADAFFAGSTTTNWEYRKDFGDALDNKELFDYTGWVLEDLSNTSENSIDYDCPSESTASVTPTPTPTPAVGETPVPTPTSTSGGSTPTPSLP